MALASCIAVPHRGVLPRLLWRVKDALGLARLMARIDAAARGLKYDLVRREPCNGHRLIRAALVVEDTPRIGRAIPSLEHPPVGRGGAGAVVSTCMQRGVDEPSSTPRGCAVVSTCMQRGVDEPSSTHRTGSRSGQSLAVTSMYLPRTAAPLAKRHSSASL